MAKSTDFKFKCIDENKFTLEFNVNASSWTFDKVFNKVLKKAKDKKKELEEFKESIEEINSKTILPDSMKTLFEGSWRKTVRKTLTGISERGKLIFYSWELDDAIFKKIENKKWNIKIIFKGDYAKKPEGV